MQIDYPTLPDVKYVAFDFCGTLVELLPSTSELLQGFVRSTYGLEVSAPAIQEALEKTTLELPYSSVKINSRELRASYYHEFNARLLGYLGCAPAMPDELYDHFSAHKRHWKIKTGGREMLDELGRRGYGLVVASNFDDNLEKLLVGLGVRDSFSHLFVSAVLGLEKPSAAFYEYIVAALGCEPGQIVMVGDDLVLDIYPSSAVGMNNIHLDHDEGIRMPRRVQGAGGPYIHVPDFAGILDVLPGSASC